MPLFLSGSPLPSSLPIPVFLDSRSHLLPHRRDFFPVKRWTISRLFVSMDIEQIWKLWNIPNTIDRLRVFIQTRLAIVLPSAARQLTIIGVVRLKFQNCSRKTTLVARRYRRAIPFCRMDFPRQRRETILLAGHRRTNVSLPKKRSHHGNEGNDRTNQPNGCVFSGELHSPRADSLRGRLPTSLHDSRFHREGSTIERSLYFAARKKSIERDLSKRTVSDYVSSRTVTEYENTRGSYLVCIVRIFANSIASRVVAFELDVGPKYHIIFIANNAQQSSRYERTYL